MLKPLKMIFFLPLFMFARDQVAIIDLEAINVSTGEAKALTQRLTSEMIKLDEFMVLERSQMDKILKEQKFQTSGCVDLQCAVEIGKLLAVKYMIVGSVSKVGKTFSLDARLINVQTGESYESADYTHTGDIDYLLVEGMKAIAHKLSGREYQVQELLPVRETIQMNTSQQVTGGSGNGATLIIKSTPTGGRVYIDDNEIGITPLELTNYPVGEYNVMIKKQNYWYENQAIRLVPMGKKEIDVNLECKIIIDCEGVCGGNELPKKYCLDDNNDGIGDYLDFKMLCANEITNYNWVQNCYEFGKVNFKFKPNKKFTIWVDGVKYKANDEIVLDKGDHHLIIKKGGVEYINSSFEINKVNQLMEIDVSDQYYARRNLHAAAIALVLIFISSQVYF